MNEMNAVKNTDTFRSSVRRGDIFIASLDHSVGSEQHGTRPVLIVGNDVGNRFSPTVIAAAVTSKTEKADIPTHVAIEAGRYGLRDDSIVLLEQIMTLDRNRLHGRIGSIDESKQQEIDEAVRCSLGTEIPPELPELSFSSQRHKNTYYNFLTATPYKYSGKYLAVIYLLTADFPTWKKARPIMDSKYPDLADIDIRGVSLVGYLLIKLAQDILDGTTHITVKDICDNDFFYNKTLFLYFNAIRIAREGYSVLEINRVFH